METLETTPRTIETIKQEYRTYAAMIGQVDYETHIKKTEIIEKMKALNLEAIALETPADEKN